MMTDAELDGLERRLVGHGLVGDFTPRDAHALLAFVRELRAERDHWKANHDEMVARNALLRTRPDLPLERIQHYDSLVRRAGLGLT